MSICLVGNYNIDQLLGPLDALPAWGTEYVVPSMSVRTGGAVGNTALALAALGERPFCVGNLGDDAYGSLIRQELASAGADLRGLMTTTDCTTGIGVTLVRKDGERAFVTYLGHLTRFDAGLLKAADAVIAEARYILMAGLFLLPGLSRAALAETMRGWRARGQIVALDTGWDPADWQGQARDSVRMLLQATDIFLPNREEATALVGGGPPEELLSRLLALGPSLVAIKLGPEGAIAAARDDIRRVHGHPVQVADTCGAGDVFNAGILYGLSRGWCVERCVAFANAQAALAIAPRPGTRFPSLSEIELLMGKD